MEKWPTFHNGVAAGLRIVSSEAAKKLDKIFAVNSHWITFNKPKYVLHQNEMVRKEWVRTFLFLFSIFNYFCTAYVYVPTFLLPASFSRPVSQKGSISSVWIFKLADITDRHKYTYHNEART